MQSRVYRSFGNLLIEINGKQYSFTGERYPVDEKGRDFYFEPHETKYFIIEEKEF